MSILGTCDRGQWIESLRTLADLAPDVVVEAFRILTWNRHGRVDLARRYGTREGGPFENLMARVILTGGDRIQRFEVFDLDATAQALARFEELCADSS